MNIVKTNILYLESFDTELAILEWLGYFYQFMMFIVYDQMMIMHIEHYKQQKPKNQKPFTQTLRIPLKNIVHNI